jgi:hypothetical protein
VSTKLRREPVETHILSIYLHDDGIPFDCALKTTAQVAIRVLQIAHFIYPTSMEIKSIRADSDEITTRYRPASLLHFRSGS